MNASVPHRDVLSLISEEATAPGDAPELGGWMQRLCRAATRELEGSGAGVSIMSDQGNLTVLAASSPATEMIEQLQFTLGEGPCRDAHDLGAPVLTPDLSEAARTRWPGYASAVQGHGVRAVFAFPLQLGAARIGALDVYRDRTGELSAPLLAQALAFAEAAMNAVLDAQQRSNESEEPEAPTEATELEGVFDGRFDVYQAQGMVQVQLGVSLGEAMARLRGYAFAHNRPLTSVAADVLARRLIFEPDL